MADYQQELAAKLEAAKKRVRQGRQVKALRESAPDFFEIIDGEVKNILAKMTAPKPLSYEEYLSAHGESRGIAKVRALFESKEAEEVAASQEVEAIQDNIKQLKNDQKQK